MKRSVVVHPLIAAIAGAALAHPGHAAPPSPLTDLAHFVEHMLADLGPLAAAVPRCCPSSWARCSRCAPPRGAPVRATPSAPRSA